MEQSVPSIWVSMRSWFTPTVLFVFTNVVILIIAFFPSRKAHNRLPRQLSRTASIFDGFKSFNLHRQSTQDPIPSIETVGYVPAPGDGYGSLPHQLSRTSSFMESLRSFSICRQNTQDTIQTVEAVDQHPPESESNLPRQLSRTSSFLESLRSFSIYRQNTQDTIPTVEAVDQHPPESESILPRQLSRTSSIFESLRSFNLYRQNNRAAAPPVTTVEQQGAFETVESVVHGDFIRSQSETHPGAEERQERVGLRKMKKSASTRPSVEHVAMEEDDAGGVRRPLTTREGKVTKEDEEVDARADDFINRFRQQLKLQRLDSILRYKEMLNRGK